ncbi:MAG: DMT family transporter, partial [Acidimicrobiia bacterium]
MGAAAGASAFGATLIAVSVLRSNEVPPFTIGLIRFGGAALILVMTLTIFNRRMLQLGEGKLWVLGAGVVGFGLFAMTFNVGLTYTTASRAAVVIGTLPIWSMIMARRLTGERLSPRQATGAILTVLGVTVVMATRGFGDGQLVGDALMLATAILGAGYSVLAKRAIATNRAITVTIYAMLVGAAALIPVSLFEGVPGSLVDLGRDNWLLLLFATVIGAAFAWL